VIRAVGLLWLVPLGAFALQAAFGAGSFDVPARAWASTLVVAATAAALAVTAALPVAVVLADGRGRWARALSLLPLLFPPILGASAWFGLGLPIPGPAGCGAILGAGLWPAVAFPLAAALSRIPSGELEAAALQLGAGQTGRVVILPRIAPALAGGAGLVALLAASEFTVPSAFGLVTVSTVVFDRLARFEFGAAWAACLPLVAAGVLAAFALRRLPWRPGAEGGPLRATWARPLAALVWILTAAGPALVAAMRVGSPARFVGAMRTHGEAVLFSLLLAVGVALVLVAWSLASARRSRLEAAWVAALVIPGLVPAFGLLLLAGPLGLGSSALLLAWALASRFAAVAWLPLRDRVDRGQLEAAELAGWSRLRAWRHVVWPAVASRAAATAAVVFALVLAEAGPSILLAPPGGSTVVQHLFNLLHYGYDETVAALGLALAAAAGLGAYAGRLGRA